MTTRPPRVSISLPVYNGERYLKETIDSILAQTFGDFEVIIADNASTDGTEEICRTYAGADRRIRYCRWPENRGATWNHNRTFELSVGEYFKWAAHDDTYTPDFLARCVEVLDHDASAVLCCSRTMFIDEHGTIAGQYPLRLKTDSPVPHERFRELILIHHWCYPIFGVIRSNTLKMTPLMGYFSSADRVLLARLGLLGRFHEIPEYLFFYREHGGQSTRVFPTRHLRAPWFAPSLDGRIIFPDWRIFAEYRAAIRDAPLRPSDRAHCYLHLACWLGTNRNWARMGLDLVRVSREILGRRSRDGRPPALGGTARSSGR
ncbi:MAG: glycosyltransferase family 2 protein [Armatimonadota bacterium]